MTQACGNEPQQDLTFLRVIHIEINDLPLSRARKYGSATLHSLSFRPAFSSAWRVTICRSSYNPRDPIVRVPGDAALLDASKHAARVGGTHVVTVEEHHAGLDSRGHALPDHHRQTNAGAEAEGESFARLTASSTVSKAMIGRAGPNCSSFTRVNVSSATGHDGGLAEITSGSLSVSLVPFEDVGAPLTGLVHEPVEPLQLRAIDERAHRGTGIETVANPQFRLPPPSRPQGRLRRSGGRRRHA